jgi:multidrug efflux pump subunit AcrB
LTRVARQADPGANIKLVEVPPGPPVIATVTAEVYGPPDRDYASLIAAARRVQARMDREPGIVDVDVSAEDDQRCLAFETDQPKAALSGVSKRNIAHTLHLALDGRTATVVEEPGEVNPLLVELRLSRSERSAKDDLRELYVRGEQGQLVQLGALGDFEEQPEDKTIYHKNLQRVVYVFGEVAGRPPADAIMDMEFDRKADAPPVVAGLPTGPHVEHLGGVGGVRRPSPNSDGPSANSDGPSPNPADATEGAPVTTARPADESAANGPVNDSSRDDPVGESTWTRSADETTWTRPVAERTWLSPGGGDPWSIPEGYAVHWAGEGEWKITLDVFRDLGLAFAAALVGIFVILMFQTNSQILPLVIMLAIPLTLIGIMPGFWVLNLIADQEVGGYPNPVFFTATAMIGMIALAGIVVRNSVVLIDFIGHGQAEGLPLREAVIQSVAVRTRPILLTAGTTLLGNWVITLDPIFSSLAWAIIFGILTSTIFTLLVIPVVYWLLYGGQEGRGQRVA